MLTDGNDATHSFRASTARKFRSSTPEERATYRRWLRGIIFFYFGLLFLSGVAAVTYSGTGRTQITKLSVHQTARAD